VVEQGVDESAAIAGIVGGSGSGVDHHAGGLVDDGEIVVFENDVEGDFFGDGAQGKRVGRSGDGDLFFAIAFQTERGLGMRAVDQNFSTLDELLDAGAADFCLIEFGELEGQVLVEALSGRFGRGSERDGEVRHFVIRLIISALREAVQRLKTQRLT